jgi:selenocysteine lyase/cysteine desulfurase
VADPISLDELSRLTASTPTAQLAGDEAFWARLATGYDRDDGFVQLNYGHYHPSLRPVVEVEVQALRELNRRGGHFKRFDSAPLLEATRADLAALAGVDPGEIAITRNASEALNVVLQGLQLAPGDELVCSDQDYAAVAQACDQRARADGVVLRRVPVPLDPQSDEEVVQAFAAALGPRTRLLLVTHLIHFTGQLLPAAKLCALGRRHGVPVLVDAAHSFAQIDFSIAALGCDYLAASLHKWLGGPLGTGLLYVRKEQIGGLRPLFGDTQHAIDDIRRLERFGNRPDSAWAGLREAVRWHRALGTPLKQERLRLLQRSWSEPLRDRPAFRVFTPRDPARHGALGLLALPGVPAEQLFHYLLDEQKIFTALFQTDRFDAVRVTPGLPTSRAETARLLAALDAAAARLRR